MTVTAMDEAKITLTHWGVGMLALADDELLAVAARVSGEMSHRDVADIIAEVTGRPVRVVQLGRLRTLIQVAYEGEDTITTSSRYEIVYEV